MRSRSWRRRQKFLRRAKNVRVWSNWPGVRSGWVDSLPRYIASGDVSIHSGRPGDLGWHMCQVEFKRKRDAYRAEDQSCACCV